MFRTFYLTLALSVGFVGMAGAADEKKPTAKEQKMEVRELNPRLRNYILGFLKEKGIRVTGEEVFYASIADCPDNCNDSVGGSYCFCEIPCPEGTEEVGPSDGKYCRVALPKANVSGGGISTPLEVQMP